MQSIGKIIKIILISITVLVFVVGLYHEFWFLEYFHWPPISFVKVETDRAVLIDGIESYQGVEEFKTSLNHTAFTREVSNENKLSPGDRRPPYNMYSIRIINCSCLDIPGELYVRFFNNRLIATTFYPSNVKGFISALENDGLKFDANREAKVPPYTQVRVATDYKGQEYVDWSDIRLDKELDLWIERYS